MAESAFGFLLRSLREQRGLSLRELAQLAEVDHAYIYRLETGTKESPSEDVLSKLIRALKPGKREADMLRWLASHSGTDPGVAEYALKDESINLELFTAVASTAFRGNARPDYAKRFDQIRRILSEDEDDG